MPSTSQHTLRSRRPSTAKRTDAQSESALDILELAQRTRVLASVMCEAEKKRMLGVVNELEALAAKRAR